MDGPDRTEEAHQMQDRLDGWKEIASHLGKSPRTAIRWEAQLGLPVRRLGKAGGEIIFAYRSEIDAWLHQNPPSKRNGHEAPHEQEDDVDSEGPAGQAVASPRASGRTRTPVRYLLWAAGLGAVVLLGWVLGGGMSRDSNAAAAPGEPARFRVENDTLIVSDAAGHELFRHPFEFELDEAEYAKLPLAPDQRLVSFADLDGDGHQEVVMRVNGPSQADEATLYCFEPNGDLRFMFRVDETVQFGDADCHPCGPPFPVTRVLVDETVRPAAIIAVAQHHKFFPALVERLTSRGQVLNRYWSNGHVTVVAAAKLGDRHVVFVGAQNNETGRASLAALDVSVPSVAAPAAADRYRCLSCAAVAPVGFMLFPRSRLNEAL